ncbi:MAG: Fis family transcriptional regulator [Proteobacteria bacterium]|nr:Fis family transcriptional regulator [Pseudomonadota bacterium]
MQKPTSQQQLSISLTEALNSYMRDLSGESCNNLYQATLDVVEKELLQFTLAHCRGNISAAAKMLGMSRTTLTRKISVHKLRAK